MAEPFSGYWVGGYWPQVDGAENLGGTWWPRNYFDRWWPGGYWPTEATVRPQYWPRNYWSAPPAAATQATVRAVHYWHYHAGGV